MSNDAFHRPPVRRRAEPNQSSPRNREPGGGGLSRRDFVKTGVGASIAPTLLGCLGSPNETSSGGPRLTARPGTPSVAPTVGLSALGIGGSRDGLLYVPAGHTPDTAAPLFVALHGAGGDADNWESYHERAETRGMVLLIPDARSSTWDALRTAFGPDVEFLNQALQHTFDRCRVDPARIVLGGFSDGASYALSLGIANGDLFSHLVAFSPGFIVGSEPMGRPPVFVSHGTNDNVLPVVLSRDSIVPDLRNAGYDVTYEEFDGGHAVPAEVTETALDWFLT